MQIFFERLFLVLLGLVISFSPSFAQQDKYEEAGRFRIQNYSPKDYNASTQNWAFARDAKGLMYVGNTSHLLSFDGNSWSRIKIGGDGIVRSLASCNESERVYVGGAGEVGYVYTDSLGLQKYNSLTRQIPDKYRKFGNVRKTICLSGSVFFLTEEFMLEYSQEEFKAILPRQTQFRSAFKLNGNIYIQEVDRGILEYKDGRLFKLPNTLALERLTVVGMIPFKEGIWLIATRKGTFFTYDYRNNKLSPFSVSNQDLIANAKVQTIAPLLNERIAIATNSSGIIIINHKGEWENLVSELSGLQDNVVWNLYVDENGDLWAALNRGLSLIETSSAYTFFDETSRLDQVNDLLRYEGKLYAATSQGLSYYNAESQIWESVDGVLGQVWDLEIYQHNSRNKALLIGGKAGVFALNPYRKDVQQVSKLETKHFEIDKDDERIVYLSTSDGLKKMLYSYWQIEDTPIDIPVKRTVQHQARLWVQTEYKGIGRVPKDDLEKFVYQEAIQGINSDEINQLISYGNELELATTKGLFVYDSANNKFVVDSKHNNFLADKLLGTNVRYIKLDSASNSKWLLSDDKLFFYEGDSTVDDATTSFIDIDLMQVYPDERYQTTQGKTAYTWIATSHGLLRYDHSLKNIKEYDSLDIHILSLSINDSLVNIYEKHRLPSDFEKLTVKVNAPFFGESQGLMYRHRLLPSREKWSEWSKKNEFDFTLLPSGEYELNIQAINSAGMLSNTVKAFFEVKTPWYLRWWAYVGYVLVIFLLAIGFTYLHERGLKNKNKELNALITARTQEIEAKNQELEQQQIELLNQSQEVFHQKEELASQAEYLKQANVEVSQQKRSLEYANKRLKMVSDISREITAILDVDELSTTVFQRIIGLVPAEGFGIGFYNKRENKIEFNKFIEKGKILKPHYDSLEDTHLPSVEAFLNDKVVVINNVYEKIKNDFGDKDISGLKGEIPYAVIYVPLMAEGEQHGVMTIQTFYQMDYKEQDTLVLQSIASATAIALSNIKAYKKIEEHNKQVTDSIRYAQTIQESILPTAKELKRTIGDHYIYYSPKDIVSGDFYWTGYNQGYQYAAVVDCTGHGVPGAFMSMVGSSLLREILYEKEILAPADMLEYLDEGIKTALRQDRKEGSNTDGMDLLLIRYTYDEDGMIQLDFAGAKRPLYYKRADEEEVVSIRGTSRSIGGIKRKHKPFEEHHLSLPPRTMLFLTSDGLADQPNDKRKKYGTKRFLKNIKEWAHLPLKTQKENLIEDVNRFRGEAKQRDDITVMAIMV